MNTIGRELDYMARLQQLIYGKKRKARMANLAQEPYNTPPEGNEPFNNITSIAGQGTGGTTPIVLSFPSPFGWDGLIQWFLNQYTGSNFVNGSQSLIWAIRIDGCYVKGYQDIRTQFTGSPNGERISPGIRFKSGQLVEVICTVDPTFVPQGGSNIIAGCTGYFYPKGSVRTR
jgi:hypothetical protein